MTSWISSIILGVKVYMLLAGVVCIPFEGAKVMITKRFNPLKFIIGQLFILYLICVFTLCFFPLPEITQIGNLTYNIQKIPFFFVSDIIKNFSVEAVCQVVFNVVLTVPFGIVLCYMGGMTVRKATLVTLILSIVIEFGQLTGFFFMFEGSYRICDVDDLILNTLGGFIGSVFATNMARVAPTIASYDIILRNRKIALKFE